MYDQSKNGKKLHTTLATLLAVSMLSVTPVWAAETTTTTSSTKQEQAALPETIKKSLEKLFEPLMAKATRGSICLYFISIAQFPFITNCGYDI
ncbi:hypothetical protein EEL32_17380 [Brevibacillus laterosporus]|uniref:Uncharacterized protein n=1 Tax=Brevibacillus laterosporus TaxID=1465 RepID=A0A502HA67_BRELA|nr:hypothetical protein EEL30_04945 [Brevibacillus laterosporus]TPG70140.1 hypothetical protein EEL31_17715 [Brevibacillus laterosporus]TPG83534.1 hypothetical protein EEL32_17380 [Brevibacillus laterosporus]